MPKNAHEFFERYANRVAAFAKKFMRNDNWEEAAQMAWLKIFEKTTERSLHPGLDAIQYANVRAVEWGETSEALFLGYIRGMVQKQSLQHVIGKNDSADAMNGNRTVYLGHTTPDAETGEDTTIAYEDWLHDKRNRQRDPMKNDPDRVVYLQQFLAFVEKHDPEILPFFLAIEQVSLLSTGNYPAGRINRIGRVIGLNQEQSHDYARRLTALAEQFEGEPLSGEIQIHHMRDYLPRIGKRNPTKKRVIRECPPKEELLELMSRMKFMEIGRHYNVDAMKVRDWALSFGVTRRHGKVFELPPERLERFIVTRARLQGNGKRGRPSKVKPAKELEPPKEPKKRGRPRTQHLNPPKPVVDVELLRERLRFGRRKVMQCNAHVRWHVKGGTRKQGCRYCETEMNTSQTGIGLIKKFEGFVSHVYVDLAGYRTIGFGHKLTSGETYTSVTVEQAEEILQRDVAVAEAKVVRLVRVKLTQGQFDALVSFVFNLGSSRLASSTLLRLLNSGKYQEAADQLLAWDHAGGREVPGLKARREAERQLWMSL